MFTVLSHDPAAVAFDFHMFKQAPVAVSYPHSVSANAGLYLGYVTNRVMSSLYATAAVGVALSILIAASVWSRRHSKGIRLKANINTLNRQSCHTPQCMGIGPVVCPLMWIEEYGWSYMFFMKAMNLALKPYSNTSLKKYTWKILSNASVKSS